MRISPRALTLCQAQLVRGACAVSGLILLVTTTATALAAEPGEKGKARSSFDHGLLDRVVKTHVDGEGRVDYAGLSKDSTELDAYIASLALADLDEMNRDEKLALLINAYNAFTLRLILDYYPVTSIKDIPKRKRWTHQRWRIGRSEWSLDDIEHKQIRPVFNEPRIHFALVCAAVGCPPLRAEAYTADRLDAQLEAQTRYVHTHDRWFKMEPDGHTVHLTRLYDWYGGDFEAVAGSVLAFAARYAKPLRKTLETGVEPAVRWLDYDWSLNRQPSGGS